MSQALLVMRSVAPCFRVVLTRPVSGNVLFSHTRPFLGLEAAMCFVGCGEVWIKEVNYSLIRNEELTTCHLYIPCVRMYALN